MYLIGILITSFVAQKYFQIALIKSIFHVKKKPNIDSEMLKKGWYFLRFQRLHQTHIRRISMVPTVIQMKFTEHKRFYWKSCSNTNETRRNNEYHIRKLLIILALLEITPDSHYMELNDSYCNTNQIHRTSNALYKIIASVTLTKRLRNIRHQILEETWKSIFKRKLEIGC